MDRGPYIVTFTGKRFYPFDPKPEEVDVLDIAWTLSTKNRFGGHAFPFYSVAQHSVHVSQVVECKDSLVPCEMRYIALLHDAAEAYVGDVPRPIRAGMHKAWLSLHNVITDWNLEYVGESVSELLDYVSFERMEQRVWEAIAEKLDLPDELPPPVRLADDRVLATEARDLMAPGELWCINAEPFPVKIEPLSQPVAYEQFLNVLMGYLNA